jgi:hypothetical protein
VRPSAFRGARRHSQKGRLLLYCPLAAAPDMRRAGKRSIAPWCVRRAAVWSRRQGQRSAPVADNPYPPNRSRARRRPPRRPHRAFLCGPTCLLVYLPLRPRPSRRHPRPPRRRPSRSRRPPGKDLAQRTAPHNIRHLVRRLTASLSTAPHRTLLDMPPRRANSSGRATPPHHTHTRPIRLIPRRRGFLRRRRGDGACGPGLRASRQQSHSW